MLWYRIFNILGLREGGSCLHGPSSEDPYRKFKNHPAFCFIACFSKPAKRCNHVWNACELFWWNLWTFLAANNLPRYLKASHKKFTIFDVRSFLLILFSPSLLEYHSLGQVDIFLLYARLLKKIIQVFFIPSKPTVQHICANCFL